MPKLTLSDSQYKFLTDPAQYRAFVAGYGAGKTFIGCLDQIYFMLRYPKRVVGYFGLNYTSIRDIYHPKLPEILELINDNCREGNPYLRAKFVVSGDKNEVIITSGRNTEIGVIKMRSLTNPEKIVGFEIMHALIDEIDVLPTDKARLAWNKILGRLRVKLPFGEKCRASVVTTPEGYRFVYDTFVKNALKNRFCIQASTLENINNLNDGYLQSLYDSYPPELVDAYIHGQFCNLTSGVVYNAYNRKIHRCNTEVQPNEPLYIGMDFNVGKMAASVGVIRDQQLHFVGEVHSLLDTPVMISALKRRFPSHSMTIYPDASGDNRHTAEASDSDISLLKRAGFGVVSPNANGLVRDRVIAANVAFSHDKVYVNDAKAPRIADCLEQQSYDKNGSPDKSAGNDHQNDATTYLISRMFPFRRPVMSGRVNVR